jgi:hypothetical protein
MNDDTFNLFAVNSFLIVLLTKALFVSVWHGLLCFSLQLESRDCGF